MGQSARWQRGSGESASNINPPKDAATQILDMVEDWRFPAIAGVVTSPIMRPDGTVLLAEGYDDATGLVLFDPPPVPPIPERPNKDDANRALAALRNLLNEFPFDGKIGRACPSRSVALSAMMRQVMPTTPLDGTHPDSGWK